MLLRQGYAFKAAYFDFFDCPGEFAITHALRKSRYHGVSYMRWHVLATMSITMSSGLIAKVFEASQDTSEGQGEGVGEGVGVDSNSEEHEILSFAQRALYSVSFAVALLSLRYISELHERANNDSCQVSVCGVTLDTISVYFFATATCLLVKVEAASEPLVYQCCLVFLFMCGTTSGLLVQMICGGRDHSVVDQQHVGDFERFAAISGSVGAGPTESTKLINRTTGGAQF